MMGMPRYCSRSQAKTAQFLLTAPILSFQMAVEPIAGPDEFGAQRPFEAQHSANVIYIKIRARRQQHRMIARRAVSLENRQRQRPEFLSGFQGADKGFGPRLEHRPAGAAHDHAYRRAI